MPEPSATAISEPSSPYRSDLTYPIGDGESDPFGHRDYADSIETALRAVPNQFTLGLFGPWGSGKSTILGEVARRANRPAEEGARRETVLVVFDAWRYDGDALRREFIRAVGEQLKAQGALPKRFKVEKKVEAFEVDVTRPRDARPRLTWASVFYGLLSALIVAGVIGALYAVIALIDPGDKTKVKAEIALLGPLIAFVLVVAGRLVSPVQLQESRRRLEFPEQFMKTFQGLLDKVKADRVVIAIDNLDRCSPKRVAEMLTTIKTFLEPALQDRENPGAKSLCFIIAADDEALRRHLIAEEMAASTVAGKALSSDSEIEGEATPPPDEDEVRREVETVAREAVDEYLRKFFNGSIRITDMLEDDTRGFTHDELADFVAWREIDEETERRLIELTAQGLKGNPRRIKQFVNNLELRLQLFQDRRAAGRIQIKPDVIMVAKLAILEEDLPDAFLALREEPSLLKQWHREAEMETPELPQRLVGFLRVTSDIRTDHIGAYLTLKQTRHELTLPGYGEFIEYLDEANLSVLADDLGEMNEEALAGHVEATREHFDRLVQRQTWSAAYGTARAVIELPPLRGDGGALSTHVLDRTLTHPELKGRVLRINAQTLLEVGLADLSESRAADLVEAMMVESGEDPERVGELSFALAAAAGELGDVVKRRVGTRLADPEFSAPVSLYATLAEAMPELIDPEAAAATVRDLIASVTFSGDDARLRLAVAVLPGLEKDRSELADALLLALRAALSNGRSLDDDGFGHLVDATVELAKFGTDPDVLTGIAEDIDETWEQSVSRTHWTSLELGLAVCSAGERADAVHGEALGRRVFDAPGAERRIEWVEEVEDRMPPRFKAGFLDRLRAGIAGELGERGEYVTLADSALGTEARQAIYAEASREAIGSRRYAEAEGLLAKVDDRAASAQAGELADRVEAEPIAFLEEGPEGIGLLVEMQGLLDPDRADRAAIALIEALVGRRALVPELGPVIGKLRIADGARRRAAVERLVAFEEEVQNIHRREGILRAAYLLAGKHHSDAREVIVRRLEQLEGSDPREKELAERVQSG